MRIERVSVKELVSPPAPGVDERPWSRFQNLGPYATPDFEPVGEPTNATDVRRMLYVEITADGACGLFGPIEIHQAWFIKRELAPRLIGRDALATARLHEEMMTQDRHGQAGHFVTALSAVDNALWDLRGHYYGQPVWRLLGGSTRQRVPIYASMLTSDTEPMAAARRAKAVLEQGIGAQKWFFRYGPSAGLEGMKRNLSMAEAVRDAIGAEGELMFDAARGWDVPYAREMCRLLSPLHPRWLEEPIPSEHLEGMRQIRASTSIPIASGEHAYGAARALELVRQGCVDVLQQDPDWCGGLSELVKIAHVAEACGVPLYPHGHSILPALHLAASQSPTVMPRVEYLFEHQARKQYFFSRRFEPVEGFLELPSESGLGISFNEDLIASNKEWAP